jgi:methionyl-tRNA synthetase
VLIKGQKMSKSLGTVLDPLEAADRFGPDPLRLYLMKEIVFGGDGDFTWDRFEEKYNVDLANNLGNLVNRVTAMAERYRQGRLPASPPDNRMASGAAAACAAYASAMDELAIDRACQEAFRLIDSANEYIAASEPWALAKRDEAAALDRVLWTSSEALRVATVLLSPVMPASCTEILRRLGVDTAGGDLRLDRDGAIRSSGERTLRREAALWPRLEPASTPEVALNKETNVTDQPNQVPVPDQPAPAAPGATQATTAPEARITLDEFMKIQLRVAKVVAAERVPNSKKLIKLQVDLGTEQRTLVAGIAEAYEADALVGKHVAIVANLQPARLMGIESNGMVLAASPDGGKPILVTFDQPPPLGARVR